MLSTTDLMNSDISATERPYIVASLKMLGTLLRTQPSDDALVPLFSMLKTQGLAANWPFGSAQQLEHIQSCLFATEDLHELDAHWQRLFIGPHHLYAPPWGSVYLDKENVIFGESSIWLGSFLREHGMFVDTGMHEPEDHIGLMFWYAAGFVEKEMDEALCTLLAQHMLPWSARYLALLKEHAQVPFYEGLAELAQLSLDSLAQRIHVQAQDLPLFF
ncbi:Tat proofreading chaperone DmsD [Saezia sanguinis]|uniref:Tat proofreading chaperone DmsD n=2 Tax=Saezia sanguinis TaxID=1965230 RepID=A0A433SEL5_9BURK|nr:Tat proofreading chaperone DmsD [Saezia sanguinis]